MQYNFDEVIDRSNNYSAKFLEAKDHYGTNDVIPLWIADMDFRTAQPVVDAIIERAQQGIFGYTYRPDEYFEAAAGWQKRRHGYAPDLNCMAFAPGVVPAMRLELLARTQPGDKVMIQCPVYHPFTDIVKNTGRTLVVSPLKQEADGRYVMDYEDFERKAREGVKLFLLCNPHNPVGRAWTPEELRKLGDLCVKYGIRVISDEIHADFMLFGHKHTVFASLSKELSDLTTTCTAPSKTFNLAGLQASTVIFPDQERRDAYVRGLREMDIARNNCFSLVASMAAYNEGEEWLEQLLRYLEGNMRFINEFCAAHIPALKPNLPECTYLCWIDARELGMDDETLIRFMAEKAGVAFGVGDEFGYGGSGYLRLNAACPRSVIQKALEQVEAALAAR